MESGQDDPEARLEIDRPARQFRVIFINVSPNIM